MAEDKKNAEYIKLVNQMIRELRYGSTLRHICIKFGHRSPLRLPHLVQISHIMPFGYKLGSTSGKKQFSNTL